MSGSSVRPAGSNRMLVNLATYESSGMPYCRPTEMAMEKASITPASVEPCLPSLEHLAHAVVRVAGGGHVALGPGHGEPGHGGGPLPAAAPAAARHRDQVLRGRGSRRRTGR